MSMNDVKLQARIPFDLELKNGDDDKKAYLGFTVSVRRNYKPEGDKYYPEDLIYCKAFGAKAKFIAEYFETGSNLIISGELRRDDDYEKDGETVKGQMYVNVKEVYFVDSFKSEEEENNPPKASTKSKPAAKTSSKGSTPGLNPLKKGKGPW